MTKQFHAQVETLRTRVLEMARLARQNVSDGVEALVRMDPKVARGVNEREELLNRMDVEIERDALDLLALNQPMAQDLRTLGASLKIITYIDRVGRYGYDIAKIAQDLCGRETERRPIPFKPMADAALAMYDQALEAYRDRDAAKARPVPAQDDVVDAFDEQIFRQCVTYMMEDARTITACSHYILAARHLERIADNARKIAEKSLYMATGERRLQV
ncbi:MAG TPA: phosphate signaling complex protein PhoU [Candidatus Thermoplasmatota archaeon]|nr:phosphate signaling complex protein PhoU [Candidatus Thermoplasmatota archaeon]